MVSTMSAKHAHNSLTTSHARGESKTSRGSTRSWRVVATRTLGGRQVESEVKELVAGRKVRGELVLALVEVPGADAADTEAIIDFLTPEISMPSEAALTLARRSAMARADFLREFPSATAADIGKARSKARNPHALAHRWRSQRRAFAVPHKGVLRFPLFQFDEDGAPRRDVVATLRALPIERMSEWEIALWWSAANGALDGRRPVDVLDENPEAVERAARALSAESPL